MSEALTFSDQQIRSFLLGSLSPGEQAAFEQSLFLERELEERVRLMEIDLSDDYALASLSEADKGRFERHFLLGTSRQRQLHVSNALRDRFAPVSLERHVSRPLIWSLIDFRRPTWRYAFTALFLLALIGTIWLVLKESRKAPPLVSKSADIPSRMSPTPIETHHSAKSISNRAHAEDSPTPSVHESISQTVNLSASDQPTINVSPKTVDETIKFHLLVTETSLAQYKAELLSSDGSVVFTAESIDANPDAAQMDVLIPAQLLKAGDYQIQLSEVRDETTKEVARFFFRVR